MRARFQDLQRPGNPANGSTIQGGDEASELFRVLADRLPFLFELRGENGFVLTVGFAGDRGCVQHSPGNGSPPYLMAVLNDARDDGEFVEFLAGDTPTPIPRRFCLPIERVATVVDEFLAQGSRSGAVAWEEI